MQDREEPSHLPTRCPSRMRRSLLRRCVTGSNPRNSNHSPRRYRRDGENWDDKTEMRETGGGDQLDMVRQMVGVLQGMVR